MSSHRKLLTFTLVLATAAVIGCDDPTNLLEPDEEGPGAVMAAAKPTNPGGGGGKPNPEAAGNNLSYPVIWADGVAKTLPGVPEMLPVLDGEWWYQWGTNGIDPDVTPASCAPNPVDVSLCLDGSTPGVPVADNPLPLARAYIQKDQGNLWQAQSGDWATGYTDPVNVHWIDWGDNLESVDWTTRSQVRTEVVLFQDLFVGGVPTDGRVGTEPWLEYEMRHTDGWGINEVHGLAATLVDPPVAFTGPGTRATVYSHCARLTLQLLEVPREVLPDGALTWQPELGWTEAEGYDELIRDPIFNKPVYEGGDGPGFYSAEINVKGRVIYGYTWNVRDLHDDWLNEDGSGDYRATFSFDDDVANGGNCTNALNTFFADGVTDIIVPLEEVTASIAAEEGEEPGGGAVGVLRTDLNLTYMDIRIIPKPGGGKGGKK